MYDEIINHAMTAHYRDGLKKGAQFKLKIIGGLFFRNCEVVALSDGGIEYQYMNPALRSGSSKAGKLYITWDKWAERFKYHHEWHLVL